MRRPIILRTRPGVSLVIAMLMVMAFMIMMANLGQSMIRTQNVAKGGFATYQSELLAKQGVELGLYSQNKPDKFPALMKARAKDKDVLKLKYDDKGGEIAYTFGTVSWKVSGTQGEEASVCMENLGSTPTKDNVMAGCPKNKTYLIYPLPGTGSVGISHCNIQTQPVRYTEQWLKDMYLFMNGTPYAGTDAIENTDFTTSVKSLNVLDHPCLWNTLQTGASAEIPLFIVDKNKDVIGPKHLKEFYVRARLPCKKGMGCSGEDRYELQYGGNEKNQRVLTWDIRAQCKDSPICYLFEFTQDALSTYYKNPNNPTIKGKPLSAITKEVVDFSNSDNPIYNVIGFKVKGTQKYGQDSSKQPQLGPIEDFLKSKGAWSAQAITKPFFNLSVATPLIVDLPTKQTVDAIEYQILYTLDKDMPPIITNPIVSSQGFSQGYGTALQSSVSRQTGVYSYGLVGE